MGFFAPRKQAAGVAAGAVVGSVLAATGVGLPLAPVGGALAYLIGALVAPGGPGAVTGPTSLQTAEALDGELKTLSTQMSHRAAQLPQGVNKQWDRIKAALRLILERKEQLAASAHQLFTVSRSIRDYVPTSIAAYLALPAPLRATQRVRSGRTAPAELEYQMTLLADELERVRDAVIAGDAQALADHGRFLEDKFIQSDLQAAPETQLKPPTLDL